MSTVKISVEDLDGSNKQLHEIDKSKSLDENVKSVCKLFGKPLKTTVYGFKLISTNDGKILHTYISDDNFDDIKDGYFLKLVYSISYYVKRIFDHINDTYKEQSFQDLYNLSVDPEFIKELVKKEKHLTLIDLFTTNKELSGTELTACLIAIVHLFQKGYINSITSDFLNRVILVLKSESTTEQIKYALSVVHKILYHRDPSFSKWKEEIIKKLPITELTPYIWSEESRDLQYGALLLINAIIKCCKGDKRQQLIKEINLKQNRENIYKHIILAGNIDKIMAHELYVYQTYLLSLFAEALNSHISLNDSELFRKEEYELEDDEIARISILMDFDEDQVPKKSGSVENLLECNDQTRISLASMSSKMSEDTQTSSRGYYVDNENLKISVLTLEALSHYKKYHYKNFYQSQVEERIYEPGIFITSERIIRMLSKILHIGMEPDRSSTFYQPTVFNCSSRIPFFLELFSRTMWLLSKTRREMKASTLNDYEKVINVLEKQVKLVLEEKPMDFKMLTEKMISITYQTVMKYWQKEKQDEMDIVLATNPSVQVLKAYFREKNEELVLQQRMNYLHKGTIFPKIQEKKISGHFMAKLLENRRQLITCDFNPATKKYTGELKTYTVSNITHIVEGRACPHVINNTVKEAFLAFSIIIDNSEYVNFKAKDRKSAAYWVDAFNLLLEKDQRSQYYKDELNQLVKMDLVLHLMELQNVTIPKKAPPVPPSPFERPPPVPPKPKFT